MTRREKSFRQLHHEGELLLLPNVWDPLGALLLQDLGYPAVATSSYAVALSNGYQDGERLPFQELLSLLKRIVSVVNIPVTADIECGYASNNAQLKEHINHIIDTGVAGINFEDSISGKREMIHIKDQCDKIELIKETALARGSDLFVNARIDVYIHSPTLNDNEKLSVAIERGRAYKEAGADGLYPIILKDKKHLEVLVQETGLPINITLLPGSPDLKSLQNIGIARISMASGFLKTAFTSMKKMGEKLLLHENVHEEINNMVSSEYLNNLIPGK